MLFIPPLEIASKIMTLIQDAEKHLIIVSPYVNLNNWQKMVKCLERALLRGVKITFILRKNATQDYSELEKIGIHPILIDNLHAKVYVNEKYGIVTSLNLVLYSEINSIDIAYCTQNEQERAELINFVNKYVTKIGVDKGIALHSFNYQNLKEKIKLTEDQVYDIYDAFCDKFWDAKFKMTSTYVFSGNILNFADVMIDSEFTIKINRQVQNCERIIEIIQKIDFQTNHIFKCNLQTTHDKFYYLYIAPDKIVSFDKLIKDYKTIIKAIHNNSDLEKINRNRLLDN